MGLRHLVNSPKKIALAAALACPLGAAAVPLSFELAGHVMKLPAISEAVHGEQGQFWFDAHTYDEFNETSRMMTNGDPKDKKKREYKTGIFPDPSVIGRWPLTQDNSIAIYSGSNEEGKPEILVERRSTRKAIVYEEIPEVVKRATKLREDRNEAEGVNWRGVARALVTGKGGGSGIDIQIAKWLYTDKNKLADRGLGGKILEGLLAEEISETYTREQRLAFYLSEAQYGPRTRGAKAAAEQILGKDLNDVTLAEALFLSVLPNNPSFDPRKDLGFKRQMDEYRTFVLSLKDSGLLTQEEFDLVLPKDYLECRVLRAEAECKDVNPVKVNGKREDLVMQSPYASAIASVLGEFKRYGLDITPWIWHGDFGEVEHASFGFKVYTNMDPDLSKDLAKVIRVNSGKKDPNLEVSAVVIDREGRVVAIIEKNNEFWSDTNLSTEPLTQIASAIKPFEFGMVYQEGVHTPLDELNDTRLTNSEPRNWDGYGRTLSLRRFLALSNNVITNRITGEFIREKGFETYLRYLKRLGFDISQFRTAEQRCLDRNRRRGTRIIPGLCDLRQHSLGGRDVSVLDVAGAYSTLIRGGDFSEPRIIDRIKVNGRTYVVRSSSPDKVFSPKTVRDIKYSLQTVARKIIGDDLDGKIGVKTGTCAKARCGWTAGYMEFPDKVSYAVAFLVRREDNKPMGEGVWGANSAGPFVRAFARKLAKQLPASEEVLVASASYEEVAAPKPEVYDDARLESMVSDNPSALRTAAGELRGKTYDYPANSAEYAKLTYYTLRIYSRLHEIAVRDYGADAEISRIYRDEATRIYTELVNSSPENSEYRNLARRYDPNNTEENKVEIPVKEDAGSEPAEEVTPEAPKVEEPQQ